MSLREQALEAFADENFVEALPLFTKVNYPTMESNDEQDIHGTLLTLSISA